MRELQYRWHCVTAFQTVFCTVDFKILFKEPENHRVCGRRWLTKGVL